MISVKKPPQLSRPVIWSASGTDILMVTFLDTLAALRLQSLAAPFLHFPVALGLGKRHSWILDMSSWDPMAFEGFFLLTTRMVDRAEGYFLVKTSVGIMEEVIPNSLTVDLSRIRRPFSIFGYKRTSSVGGCLTF